MNYTDYKDLLRQMEIIMEVKQEKLQQYREKSTANPIIVQELTQFYNFIDMFIEASHEATQQAYIKGLDKGRENKQSNNYRSKEQIRSDHFINVIKKWEDHY